MAVPLINPLVHSGNSSNIAFYGERGKSDREPGRVWCEVLRSAWPRSAPVTYHVTVYRVGEGEIGRVVYKPLKAAPNPLPARTVTRLVREFLEALPDGGSR